VRPTPQQLTEYRRRIRVALGNLDREGENAWWLRKCKALDNRRPWDVWAQALSGHDPLLVTIDNLEHLVEVAHG
jgi:hypothetical protein